MTAAGGEALRRYTEAREDWAEAHIGNPNWTLYRREFILAADAVAEALRAQGGAAPTDQTALSEDAKRWAWVCDHAFLIVGEDDDVMMVAAMADDFSEPGAPTLNLTPEEIATLNGDGNGHLPNGDAITRAVDAKRAALSPDSLTAKDA